MGRGIDDLDLAEAQSLALGGPDGRGRECRFLRGCQRVVKGTGDNPDGDGNLDRGLQCDIDRVVCRRPQHIGHQLRHVTTGEDDHLIRVLGGTEVVEQHAGKERAEEAAQVHIGVDGIVDRLTRQLAVNERADIEVVASARTEDIAGQNSPRNQDGRYRQQGYESHTWTASGHGAVLVPPSLFRGPRWSTSTKCVLSVIPL